jgi:RAQPRD family integrative conjugative element protein
MNRITLLNVSILLLQGVAIASPESTRLALELKQLEGVKTSLERAQTSASTDQQSRYFFYYLQAQQDICAVEQGIRRYLSPVTLAQIQCSAKSEIFVFPETSDEFSRSHFI